ncbi:hypothetical protein [Hugenholtzia roseola]|uniref:hypothetical protein n=1 Tax=Hugenholtzia roseola TaxID=1002 RepID=UPI0003F774EA|nr:hypothetical protein [Hugenholtzia roseola]
MKRISQKNPFSKATTRLAATFALLLVLTCEQCFAPKVPEGKTILGVLPHLIVVEQKPKDAKNWDPVNMFSYDHKPDIYYQVWAGSELCFQSEPIKDVFQTTFEVPKEPFIPSQYQDPNLTFKFYDHDKKLGVKTGSLYNEDDLIGEYTLKRSEWEAMAAKGDSLRFQSVLKLTVKKHTF